jgi:hypothetical protein
MTFRQERSPIVHGPAVSSPWLKPLLQIDELRALGRSCGAMLQKLPRSLMSANRNSHFRRAKRSGQQTKKIRIRRLRALLVAMENCP